MKLGDQVKKQIYTGPEGGSLLPAETGTVVYIHPEGRFYTLEFTFERHGHVGTVRESFPLSPGEAPPPPPATRAGGSVAQIRRHGPGHYLETGYGPTRK